MKTITLTVDMGLSTPVAKMTWEKPVPILVNFNYTTTPLGVARLYRQGLELKAECHFTAWQEEFEFSTPAIGGVSSKDGFTVMALSLVAKNQDQRIKRIGEQLKAAGIAEVKKN